MRLERAPRPPIAPRATLSPLCSRCGLNARAKSPRSFGASRTCARRARKRVGLGLGTSLGGLLTCRMASRVLVSPSGELHSDVLAGVAQHEDQRISVIAALGSRGVAQSSLLNSIVGAQRFAESQVVGVQVTKGVLASVLDCEYSAIQAEPLDQLVVLDVEGFDASDRDREEGRDRASSLSVCTADVLLFSVRMSDIARVESNGVSSLRVCFTEMLKLQEAGVIPASPTKKGFVVVVRDYDAEVLPREELINGFMQEIQTVYDSVSRPSSSPARISDIYGFEFITLPSAMLAREAFDDAMAALRARFVDPFADDYLFGGDEGYTRKDEKPLTERMDAIWKALEKEQTRELPSDKELMATFSCDSAMRKVFEKYRRSVRSWQRDVEDGGIVEDFGDAAAGLMHETLDIFDQDAGPHRAAKAFQRKRGELKSRIEADLYEIFARQVLRLRENTLAAFKDRVGELSLSDPELEKLANQSLKQGQKNFSEAAEALRPRQMTWRFDNESKELAKHMREAATERIQQARLEDYSSGSRSGRRGRRAARTPSSRPARQPISISFHYLDPAPFGMKDSRYEKLGVDDELEYANTPVASQVDPADDDGQSVPMLPSKGQPWHREYIYRKK